MRSTSRPPSLRERVRWLALASIAVLAAGAFWTALALLGLVLWAIPRLPR